MRTTFFVFYVIILQGQVYDKTPYKLYHHGAVRRLKILSNKTAPNLFFSDSVDFIAVFRHALRRQQCVFHQTQLDFCLFVLAYSTEQHFCRCVSHDVVLVTVVEFLEREFSHLCFPF